MRKQCVLFPAIYNAFPCCQELTLKHFVEPTHMYWNGACIKPDGPLEVALTEQAATISTRVFYSNLAPGVRGKTIFSACLCLQCDNVNVFSHQRRRSSTCIADIDVRTCWYWTPYTQLGLWRVRCTLLMYVRTNRNRAWPRLNNSTKLVYIYGGHNNKCVGGDSASALIVSKLTRRLCDSGIVKACQVPEFDTNSNATYRRPHTKSSNNPMNQLYQKSG